MARLQLLEVESLDEFNLAIFTEVRNFCLREGVAILMLISAWIVGQGREDERRREAEQL